MSPKSRGRKPHRKSAYHAIAGAKGAQGAQRPPMPWDASPEVAEAFDRYLADGGAARVAALRDAAFAAQPLAPMTLLDLWEALRLAAGRAGLDAAQFRWLVQANLRHVDTLDGWDPETPVDA